MNHRGEFVCALTVTDSKTVCPWCVESVNGGQLIKMGRTVQNVVFLHGCTTYYVMCVCVEFKHDLRRILFMCPLHDSSRTINKM